MLWEIYILVEFALMFQDGRGYSYGYLIFRRDIGKPISWPVHGDVIVVEKYNSNMHHMFHFGRMLCLPKEAALSILSHAGNILIRAYT